VAEPAATVDVDVTGAIGETFSMTTAVSTARGPRTIRIGGRAVALVGPRITDPRLHVAAVIVTVQVLGQIALDWDVSIPQILVSLATCALIEIVVVLRRRSALVWPASALLTGNGIALVLRVPGTQHGDWWATRGVWIFAGTAAFAMATKYLIRVADRPLFNPSNVALVACFLVLGPIYASPLDLWWANPGIPLTIALTVILVGGVALAFRVRMVGVVLSFWLTLLVAAGILALTGHAMNARWHVGPIGGSSYWILLLTSPEILVFLFFMITDPKTAPRGRVARVVYGSAVAALAVAFASFQRTEYATKVAILAALVVVCAFRPLLERVLPAVGSPDDRLGTWARMARRPVRVLATLAVLTGALIVAGGATTERPGTGIAARNAARDCSGDTGLAPPRPRVATGPLPRVDNKPSVRVSDRFTDEQADTVARDTVEDLIILGRSRRDLDLGLAATAATTPRVTKEQADICRARAGGRIEAAARYDLDTLSVQILTRSDSQRIPEINVGLRGRVTLTTYDDRRAVDRRTVRYRDLLTVALRGDDYVIVERTPPLPPPP
jgi:Na+-translocating ferredoxin:NAD+ oxidoreductase RnfD subunit